MYADQLAQANGHIRRLLETRVDAVLTGELTTTKAAAQAQKKKLSNDAQELLEKVEMLVAKIDGTAA